MSRTPCLAVAFCMLLSSGCATERQALPTLAQQSAEGSRLAVQPRGAFNLLYQFTGHLDGGRPQADLVVVNGVFYGTTWEGGSKTCACGSVFSIDSSGHEKTLYQFAGDGDGAYPLGGLAYVDGTLYGTTSRGGGTTYACFGQGYDNGCGAVFSIDASGKERVVYSFGGGANGDFPQGDLVALDGKLYGTTTDGGNASCTCGTIFSVDVATGAGKPVFSFSGGKLGSLPMSGLTSIGGTMYGTTTGGGFCSNKSCGTVFTVTPAGKVHVVYGFKGSDGSFPWGNPVKVGDTLYGTTYDGGYGCILDGCGTIYSIDTAGKERALWLFGGRGDGIHPVGDLAVARGAIYGTTQEGGNSKCFRQYGCGTVFSFNPKTGHETAVEIFTASQGSWPLGGVIAHDGTVYGTASQGGRHDWGTVFSFKP